ncbi:hypothetical protein FB451DRAFT_996803, partial [Mycena latifolia]
PFYLLGLGVCVFVETALGVESGLMGEAARLHSLIRTLSVQGGTAAAAGGVGEGRGDGGRCFAPGLEWEILNVDTVVLLGLAHAL